MSKKFPLTYDIFETKCRTGTYVNSRHLTFSFLWVLIVLRTPCVITPSLGGAAYMFDRAHRCCPWAREKNRPWIGWLVSPRSEGGCVRDGHLFLRLMDFRIQNMGLSQAGVERSEAMRQGSRMVTRCYRRPSQQGELGGLSISRCSRVWTQCVPRTCGLLQQYVYCCLRQFHFSVIPGRPSTYSCELRVHTLREGARPTSELIMLSTMRTRDMATLFDRE